MCGSDAEGGAGVGTSVGSVKDGDADDAQVSAKEGLDRMMHFVESASG